MVYMAAGYFVHGVNRKLDKKQSKSGEEYWSM